MSISLARVEEQSAAETAVPFLDLPALHAPLKDAILYDISCLIDTGAFANGEAVRAFEEAFAGYCGVAHCVGVSSGLDALRLGLLAAGAEPGDEVVVPAMTFAATVEAVTQVGARPVLVDVDATDYALDVRQLEAARSSQTRFVLPVHLYGQMAPMHELLPLAARLELRVIEDACQAHGSSRRGFRAGAAGAAGAFSFYPGKNLGAFGDAGALVTDDAEVARRARVLREHGQTAKYRHEVEGYTARLDTIQAHVLLRKLPFLDDWNAQRRARAAEYSSLLEGVGDLILPATAPETEHVWHLYVVRSSRVEHLAAFLASRGISTGRHYPSPIHLTPAYESLGYRCGEFPVAEALADEGLSLPLYPGLSEQQLALVVHAIEDFFGGGLRARQ